MINKTAERVFIALVISILAVIAVCFAETQETYAYEYKYKITVYAGEHGTFGGNTVWTKECSDGEHIRIDFDTLNFKLNKNSKYYNLGFRVTGHDNDEADGCASMEFDVHEDLSYEVAYRIKGDMVSYTIKYVDSDSNKELHDPDTYYGMVGDKPVVAYRYIKGYEPQAYNIYGKLQRDESKNVWTFEYSKEGTQQNQQNQNDANATTANQVGPAAPGTPANPAGTNVNPNPGTENIGDTDAPTDAGDQNGNKPQQTQDIDDNDKPTASPFDNTVAIAVGTGLGVFLLLLLIWLYLMKRKNKEKSEE